ncbi:hypothetical protein DICPUDRAFT_80227 [Dictyostelium purpureum]|uniref:Enhancer of mRNA-decapping protein 4 C-terminal domain-containing protein n=1 Tax=Dictyostelium purpureum TaxID=5786 RepID=F0ZPW1_DICPU|nr:uncharacterized protein DICPUDRAFT_80227 [Dictyostelium purpureum]EGC34011.1 hypothetical protein DICPUDRAFT_80227 [Dictyostelium purpureum]|eukprot:XP_003289455.1 hypothetical protein DICPUDRAFT_80227 [Dictyostelium purpureum]
MTNTMTHEEFERQQQSQPQPINNVMRFFQNFGLPNNQEQQPQQPSPQSQQPNIFSFLSGEIKNSLTSPTISPSTSSNNINNNLNGSHSNLSSSFGNLITKSVSNNSINQNNQNNQNLHNGLYLNGKNIKINSNKVLDSKFEVESQTVTVIQSSRNAGNSLGNLITFNKNFISYVVKGEKVRILDRSSSNKVLLKDFPDVVDIQFHSEDVNILSCCSMGSGSIYIYELVNNIQTLEDVKLLAKIPPPPQIVTNEKTYYTTVKWHPTKPDILLTCTNNSPTVYCFNIHNPNTPLIVLEPPKSTIESLNHHTTGLNWSSDGASIAFCNKDCICIYGTDLPNSHQSLKSIYQNNNDEFKDGFLYVYQISENYLVAVTNQSEIILFSTLNWSVIQRITFSTSLFTNYSLFTIKDSFLFISDNNSSKAYIIHINESETDIPHFDFINQCDFKKPIISFCFQSSPSISSLNSSKGSIQQQQQDKEKEEKCFCTCTIQSNAISLHSITLDSCYSENDQYTCDSSDIIEQFGNYKDNLDNQQNNNDININISTPINEPLSPISSTNATIGSEDEDKLNTLTNTKPFVQPSSPPPLSLPEPDLTSCGVPSTSDSIINSSISPSIENNTTTNTTKAKKESTKVSKKKTATPTTTTTTTTTTTNKPDSPSLSPTIYNVTEDTLVGSTSPVTAKKKSSKPKVSSSSSSESLNQDSKETKSVTPSKTSKSLATPTTPSTPTPAATTTPSTTPTKPKNVTPSFVPPVLNIPLSNPVSNKQPGSKPKETTSPSSIPQTIPLPSSPAPQPQPQQQQQVETISSPSIQQSQPQQVSSSSSSSSSPNQYIATQSQDYNFLFKEMENRLFNRIEKSMINQITQLEKERQEREQLERERQEKLLTVVHQSITTMAKANLEKVIKKEIANTFVNLEKTLPAAIETTVTKLTLEQMKKLSAKTDSLLKSSSEAIVNNVKGAIISDAFEGLIKPQIESVFLSYFQNVLIPGFDKSCQSMFTHLSYTFENGFNQAIQHQTLNAQGQHLALEKILNENTTILKECTQSLNEQQTNLFNELKKQQEKQQFISQQLQQLQQQQPQQQFSPPPPPHHMPPMHQQQQFSPQPPFPNLPQMNMKMNPQNFYQFQNPNMMNMNSPNESFQHLQQPLSPQQSQQPQQSPAPSPPPQQQSQQQQQQSQQNKNSSITLQQQQVINQKLASYPQLKALVETNYIDAFNFALNASNLQMVVNLCSSLDPSVVLSSMKFPQTIILSLIQQLSINLTTDTELKLKWIKDCLFFVDNSKADVTKKILKVLKVKLDDPQLSSSNQHLLQQIKFMIKDI